jgi:hypothetical protein
MGGKNFKLEEKLPLKVSSIRLGENKTFEIADLFDSQYIQHCQSMLQLQQQLIELKFIDIAILMDLFDADKEDSVNEVYTKYNNYINKYEVSPNSVQIEFALLSKTILNK